MPCLVKDTDAMQNHSSTAAGGSESDDEYSTEDIDYDEQYPVYMLVASQGDCLKLKNVAVKVHSTLSGDSGRNSVHCSRSLVG
ncbi:unnamed protein product [Gongylonema pulchrum]|uniref:Uncharacterized protein n=1 Tax=Gongylonema pulchrum TaxID=637853 RepID=A0A3P6R2C2_9BILA|nr:unnamed protein product [Gongylonema pulchrum]